MIFNIFKIMWGLALEVFIFFCFSVHRLYFQYFWNFRILIKPDPNPLFTYIQRKIYFFNRNIFLFIVFPWKVTGQPWESEFSFWFSFSFYQTLTFTLTQTHSLRRFLKKFICFWEYCTFFFFFGFSLYFFIIFDFLKLKCHIWK